MEWREKGQQKLLQHLCCQKNQPWTQTNASTQIKRRNLWTMEADKSTKQRKEGENHLRHILPPLQYLQHCPTGQTNCNLSIACENSIARYYMAIPWANTAIRLLPASQKSETTNSSPSPSSSPTSLDHILNTGNSQTHMGSTSEICIIKNSFSAFYKLESKKMKQENKATNMDLSRQLSSSYCV